MNFIFGFILAAITFAVGNYAYIITLTINENNFGGYLPFAFFTFAPIVFFALGRFYPSGKVYRTGEIYKRRERFDVRNAF